MKLIIKVFFIKDKPWYTPTLLYMSENQVYVAYWFRKMACHRVAWPEWNFLKKYFKKLGIIIFVNDNCEIFYYILSFVLSVGWAKRFNLRPFKRFRFKPVPFICFSHHNFINLHNLAQFLCTKAYKKSCICNISLWRLLIMTWSRVKNWNLPVC